MPWIIKCYMYVEEENPTIYWDRESLNSDLLQLQELNPEDIYTVARVGEEGEE